MEEEIDPSQEYIDSFNLGYDLYKVSPEIAELVSGLRENIPKLDAIKAGVNENAREQNPSRLPDWLSKDRFHENKDALSNREKDKSKDIQPER